jgi:hypothetical protein
VRQASLAHRIDDHLFYGTHENHYGSRSVIRHSLREGCHAFPLIFFPLILIHLVDRVQNQIVEEETFSLELREEVRSTFEGFLHAEIKHAIAFVEERTVVWRRFANEERLDGFWAEGMAQFL